MSGHSERRGEPARRASDEWRGWRDGWPFEATGVTAPERVNVHGVINLAVPRIRAEGGLCRRYRGGAVCLERSPTGA
jgi:hypothetical protein